MLMTSRERMMTALSNGRPDRLVIIFSLENKQTSKRFVMRQKNVFISQLIIYVIKQTEWKIPVC